MYVKRTGIKTNNNSTLDNKIVSVAINTVKELKCFTEE